MIGCLQVEYSSTTAYIDHNNGNFAGANFTLTSGGERLLGCLRSSRRVR